MNLRIDQQNLPDLNNKGCWSEKTGKKNEWSFKDLWDNNKISNISFLTIQEEEHKNEIKIL